MKHPNRKFVLFFLTGLIVFSFLRQSAGQDSFLSLTYSFPAPVLTGGQPWTEVQMKGCPVLNQPGLPPLPFRLAKILLPAGTVSGRVEVESGDFLTFTGSYRLPEVPRFKKLKDQSGGEFAEFNGCWPRQPYQVLGVQRIRGYRVLLVQLFPVRFDSQKKQLSFTPELKLRIELKKSQGKNTMEQPVRTEQDEKEIRNWVDNPDAVATYPVTTLKNGSSHQYLIITSSSLLSAFQPLVNYYQGRGLNPLVVTTQEITEQPLSPYYQTGRDRAERIRNLIVYAYRNLGTRYVLLGGDTDIIPARYFANPVEDDPIPADMYYSNLDGDFDYNRNNIFGEPYVDGPDGGDVDFLAEVFVGRVPASTDLEVSRWVSKNLSYLQGTTVSLKKATMIGQQLDEISWGGDGKDDIVNRCFPANWEITRFYERDRTYSRQAVINQFNSGTHLANNFAHGDCDSAFGLNAADILSLTNTTYFILYSQGCYEAAFDNPYGYDSVTEYFLTAPAAAVAAVGNSRFGWYSPGAVRYGPSQVFDREFFNVLFNQNFTSLAEAFYRSKANLTAGIGGYQRYVYYELNLFGDPALPVVEPSQGPPEELQGLVYFVKDNNLFVSNLATEQTQQLTHLETSPGPGSLSNPTLSDDGTRIVFAYRENTFSETQLYQVNSDGSGLENLTVKYSLNTLTKNQSSGVLSPNGELLAFVAQPRSGGVPGGAQLWLKELTGARRLFQLTFLNGNVSHPLFIDTSRLLFLFSSNLDTCQDFYTISTTGASLTNLTNNSSASPYFPRLGRPSLNASRTQIIYGKQLQSAGLYSDWRIYTRSVLPAAAETEVLSGLYFAETPLQQPDPQPAFVGDSAIAFTGERPYTSQCEIFLTTYNSADPYLRSLPESERGSFPIYFLPPEKPTQIAYLDNGQIRVRRSDGSDIQLTSTVNENRDPSFSFNGEYLACAGNGIWVMKADGTDPVQVDEYFSARHPAFSPDGNWVIYVKNNDIYGRRIDRSVLPVRLTSTSSVLKSDLSFTPDGSRIIYTGSTSFGSQIFSLPVTVFETTIRVDGSPVNLTNTPGCDNFQPAVSRDGSTILFLSKRLGEPKIFAMNADGTNQRLLSFDPEPNNPGFPQFSPYGEARIMYLSGTAVWSADLSEFRAYQISPEINTDKKFAWGIYLPTRITVERQCCFNRVDPNIHFRYSLTINFNRFSPPASMIITEILPSPADGTASETWVLVDATFNDTPLSPLTSNGRTTGTLKWVISNNFPLGKPVSGTLKLTVRLAGDGPAAAIRCLNGGINDGSSYSATTGDAYLTLADPANPASCPLLPVDSDGDFFISDEELLSTIDLWVSLSQIKGWPAETSQWDYWLLKIIDFWVNPSGYAYDPALSLSADEPRWKKSP